jgi:hypothetical protein
MKLPTSIIAGLAAAGIMLSGAAAFAQPVFPAYYPNGTNLFQPSPTFSFNITDASATITNVTVQLVGTPMGGTGGSPALQLLGPSSGLNVVGLPGSAVSASCPLKTNLTYAVTITATDGNGISTTTNVSFTTIVPAFTWEAEDWDYTNGLYFDNPQTNLYAGLSGVSGTDYNDAGTGQGAAYRPSGPNGLGNENCGDTLRLTHLGKQDYDVGWNNGGYWGNYTRHYPAGTYFVYIRASSNSQQTRNADLTVVGGNGVLTGTGGTIAFRVPLTGNNQIYGFGPLLDAQGKLVTFTSDGTASTLRSTVDQGNLNANFYMLMPTNIADIPQGSITITNIYPDGIYQMEETNQFVFTISSAVGIEPNSVILQVTSSNLLGTVGSVKLLSTVNGLTLSGDPSTSLNGSMLLNTNTVYKIYIQATDSNGVPTSTTVNFDTVNPTYYTWEAEDGNYHNGQYIDNPQTNAYYDYSVAGGTGAFDCTAGVDAFYNGGGGHADNRLGGLATEGAGDLKRPQFQVVDPRTGVNYKDFDCGNSSGNSWANYTRTFPAGVYNIYLRGANGGGANSDSFSLGVVSGDPTTTAQVNNIMGHFTGPATGGWQTYGWVPLKNSIGAAIQWHSSGAPTTLRVFTDGGSVNMNYFMLAPADLTIHNAPYISAFQPSGSAMFNITSNLSFIVNSQVGVTATNIILNLNGTVIPGLITSGSPNLLNVSYPVKTNYVYTAIVTITDSYGTSTTTNVFDTFDITTTYTWETEDYDYTSGGIAGQFIDNSPPLPSLPSVDTYAGLAATEGIDEKDDAHTGSGYRPVTGVGGGAFGLNIGGLEFETAGDVPRAQYTSGKVDYNIGFNDGGNWANYTRTYPAGVYNVYMRCASPNGNASEASFAQVTGGWGTTNQTTTVLGTFAATRTGGYHTFNWAPVMASGSLYSMVLTNATTNTFRITVTGGGYNNSFYALVLADPTIPTISGLTPNGAYQFQGSSTLSFTTASPAGISSSSGISVLLTGTNLLGQTFTTNLTAANGLTITGPSTSLHVSLNLPVSGTYSAVITITALSGAQTISRPTFDTLNPTMTFEAEDWNYTDTNSGIAGLFINNPQTNAYAGLGSTAGIDYTNVAVSGGNGTYRPKGLATENCSDVPRQAYATGLQNYDVGNTVSGNWGNYTRTFPAGVYNIYMRGADGNASQTDAASMSLVTSAATNSNQTTLKLGTFSVPSIGANWQAYGNVPLIDSDGNHAEFVGGGQQTLRVTTDNGNYNPNYYFLVPEDTTLTPLPPHLSASLSGPNIVVTFLSRTNITYKLQFKTNLTDPAWTPVSTNSGTATWMSITNGMNGGSGFYSLKP